MFKRRPTISTTNGEESGTVNPDMISNIPIGRSGVENDLSEQRFHNVVITLHMFAAYLPGVLQLLWDYFGSHWTAGTTTPHHHPCLVFLPIVVDYLTPVGSPVSVYYLLHYAISRSSFQHYLRPIGVWCSGFLVGCTCAKNRICYCRI